MCQDIPAYRTVLWVSYDRFCGILSEGLWHRGFMVWCTCAESSSLRNIGSFCARSGFNSLVGRPTSSKIAAWLSRLEEDCNVVLMGADTKLGSYIGYAGAP